MGNHNLSRKCNKLCLGWVVLVARIVYNLKQEQPEPELELEVRVLHQEYLWEEETEHTTRT